LRATINAAIIALPRHWILILIVARLSSSLSRYIGGVISAKPPSRDIDGDAMWVRKLPVPNTHAYSQSEVNVEPEETMND
jgi:hypothetical protein